MSALIIDIASLRRDLPSPEQQARTQVNEQLRGNVPDTILAQARARAVRNIVGGLPLRKAVDQAVKWALCAKHDDAPLAG